MPLTVEQILNGTELGRAQSVGQMEVIPILGSADAMDGDFAPPNFAAGTQDYAHVELRNMDPDRPTIAPVGAGWLTRQHAQDHATAGAALIKPGETRTLNTAVCIQETQGGTWRATEDTNMVILPAALRAQALSMREGGDLGRLWPAIRSFRQSLGGRGQGNLIEVLDAHAKELDEFVAEFELVPNQVGAIVLLNGSVVGVERAPNIEFWERLWVPLIRVCYGTLALKARQLLGDKMPETRTTLDVQVRSLAGIARALQVARTQAQALIDTVVSNVKSDGLIVAGQGVEDRLRTLNAELVTVANTRLAGQIVQRDGRTPYVSLCAAGA